MLALVACPKKTLAMVAHPAYKLNATPIRPDDQAALVQPGGIHPQPGQTTGGNGPVTGQETVISVNFTTPFDLAAGQYFFVPQVELATSGDFLWLSAPRPIVPPGTPFPPGFTDLRAGHEINFWSPTGCGSALTSLARGRLTRPLCSTA